MVNPNFKPRHASACLLAALLCGGCVDSADSGRRVQLIAPEQAGLVSPATQAANWPAADWWRAFGDPQLNLLIEQAGESSPSIDIAQARVLAARQSVVNAHADTEPTVALNAEVDRQRYSENYIYPPPLGGGTFTDARATLDFSYEFDFWGRQRAALASAKISVAAERAELESAKLVLSIAVAQTYVALQRSYAELDLARASATQRAALAQLYSLRANRGLASRASVEPQNSAAANAQQANLAEQQNIDVLKHQLAALTGRGPDAYAQMTAPSLSATATVKPGALPADLLGRRPDIVAQRLRIEAANRDIVAAKADFYPNIDLAAFAGFQSLGIDDLMKGSSRAYGVGPALHLPIFNRDSLRANLGSRYADYDYAVAQYNQTVLDAVRDVADQKVGLESLVEQRAQAQSSASALERAYKISQLREQRGVANHLEVLEAQGALIAEQRVQAQLRERELQAALALIKALGGGYNLPPAAQQTSTGENNGR